MGPPLAEQRGGGGSNPTRRALDEVRTVASMLKGFKDRLTEKHAADLASRLMDALSVLDRATWVSNAIPDAMGTAVEPSSPSVSASAENVSASPSQPVTPITRTPVALGVELPRIRSPRANLSPRATQSRQQQERTPLIPAPPPKASGSAAAPPPPLVLSDPAPPTTTTAAKSEAVVKIAARTFGTVDLASAQHKVQERKEMETAISAAVFGLLDATVTHLHAEGGAVYVPIADEMVSIATIFPNLPVTPPPLVKHLIAGSVTGSVLTSGVAVHQLGPGLDDNNRRVHAQMLFPIIAHGGRRIGVMQLLAKYRGASEYSEADEAYATNAASLFAALLSRYNVRWAGPLYDPVALMKQSPFIPAVIIREIRDTIPKEMHSHISQPLVHRTGGTVSLAKRLTLADDAAALGTAPTLREVDCYIENLQDCWRRSVQLNIEYGRSEQERLTQLRNMREELRTAKHESRVMADKLRTEHLDVADYRAEYSTLKQELDRFLDRKRAFDD